MRSSLPLLLILAHSSCVILINATVTKVAKKVKLAFEAEMINVIDPQEKGERGHPNGDRSPYELVYKWLWEKKFPREGWKLAKKIAIYGGERLKMKLISDSERKPNLDEIPAVEDGFINSDQLPVSS